MSADGDVSRLIEEEMEEEEQFRLNAQLSNQLHPGVTIGLVHSPTTDTLDSVLLEPSPAEQDLNDVTEPPVGDDSQEGRPSGVDSGSAVDNINLDDVDFTMGGSDIESSIEKTEEKSQHPSLSNYFPSESEGNDPFGENFFDSILVDSPQKAEASLQDDTCKDKDSTNENNSGQDSGDMASHMLELTIDDAMKPTEEAVEPDIDKQTDSMNSFHSLENSNNNAFVEQTLQESVLFDMEGPECLEEIADPVDIDDKEDFESFTADLAETEALDALGMSPATQSFLSDRTIQELRHQAEGQPDFTRQISSNSNKSGTSQDLGFEQSATPIHQAKGTNLTPLITPTATPQSSVPPTPTHQSVGSTSDSASGSAQDTPTHQPAFPTSTTLSPVDSPVHQSKPQSTDEQPDDNRTPVPSLPVSPEHISGLVSAFQSFQESDDPFSASLQMSDSDRSHDAWIPSDISKNILMTVATSAPGSYTPSQEQLCCPSLVVTESQGDPVRDLVNRYMGEQEALKRQQLTATKVSQDVDGLKKLMQGGCYRSAVDLTGTLLTEAGQGSEPSQKPIQHTPETLQLWYCRFSLMMKLRMYSIIESEIQAFQTLDTPDIYYEYYPLVYPGKRGSMVVFGMRLLHAELPHHMGRSQESLDRLYYILAITLKIIKNLEDGLAEDGSAVTISPESRKLSLELWEEREKQTLYLIGNTLIAIRDYEAALSVYEILLEKDADHKLALLSGMGRIHLQMGNLPAASEFFQQVTDSQEAQAHAVCTCLMNAGFEAMCQNNFEKAYTSFKAAVQTEPENTSAVNNMAVCCLYMGQLKDALKTLEALVHRDPSKNLHEGILFNLCTLYELESSRALHKKQALLDLVSKHKGDGFPVVCLKMA